MEETLSHEEIFFGGQLLDVKLKCLELAMNASANLNADSDTVVNTARKFFEFILEETEE